jgi:hypothetical protein
MEPSAHFLLETFGLLIVQPKGTGFKAKGGQVRPKNEKNLNE